MNRDAPTLLPLGPRARIALLTGLALAVRLFVAASSQCISSDGPEYVKVASAYAAGDYAAALAHQYHPLYPVLVALVHAGIGDWEWAGMLVSAVLGGLAVLPLYGTVRRAFGENSAQAAALFYGLHPSCVHLSAEVLTVGSFLFWVLASIDLADRAARGGPPWQTALAGVCAGCGFLTRPDGLVLFPAIGGLVAVAIARGRAADPHWRRRFAAHAGALVFAFCTVAFPYLYRIHAQTGHWLPTGKMTPNQFLLRTQEAPDDDELITDHQRRISELAAASPARRIASATWRVARSQVRAVHELLALFLAAGVWAWRRRPAAERGWRRGAGLAVFPLLFLAALLYFSIVAGRESRRYTTPIAAMLLGWSGAGAAALAGAWTRRRAGSPVQETKALRTVVAVALAVLALQAFAPPGAGRGDKPAGLWIRDHAPAPGPRILTRSDRAVFYAAGAYIPIVSTERLDLESLVQRAESERADYFVADPDFDQLFDGFAARIESAGKQRLKLVYPTQPAPGERVVRVYEVLRPR